VGPRGEESIAASCRREGIATSMYYVLWLAEGFLDAGRYSLAGDMPWAGASEEVKVLRR
jgi:transposase